MVKTHSILQFATGVTLALYLVLLLCEYLRPGFVSTNMNPHALLLVVFGLAFTIPATSDARRPTPFMLLPLAIVLGLIVWHIGADFGVMRLWISLVAACTPIILLKSTR